MELAKRIYIPLTPSSPVGLIEANTVDPWIKSGKYALGWTYLCIVLLTMVTATRLYHLWTDKIRTALFKEEVTKSYMDNSPQMEYAMTNLQTGRTEDQLFPREVEKPSRINNHSHALSSIGPVNDTMALFRWIFYRPIPELTYWKKRRLSFPSLAVVTILTISLAFITLYCFLQQPLYWQSIQYGSPPLAIRSGMIAVAMTPWIVATSMKANLISALTGIGHDRLNVLHRWGGYLCLFMALVHTIPFYVTPVWDHNGLSVFKKLFTQGGGVIYGTGIAALVPLIWLCVASLPIIRSLAYELFVVLHVPVAIVYLGLLFWHTHNYLTSWSYLYATVAIWALSYAVRLFNLNWTNPRRMSWLIGDEAAVTLMAENAIKVTIPTQMKWRPGQYVYLRMPGISLFENHPFTISSLCSADFPSEYGEAYRDCTLVFRPFGGFTKKVLETAIEKGPFKTYRAFLDGPYGGMQRELAAFNTVILFAGGSGITAIVSQLLNLIKRMRDGKAVTTKVEVVWALKRLEAMDWFKEELRICREFAPPDTVTCQFYVTAAKRQTRIGLSERAPRPLSTMFHDKLDGFVAGIASKRNSAYIRDEAQGDEERERELREENEDAITALPRSKHLQPTILPPHLRDQAQKDSLVRDNSLRRLEGQDATSEQKEKSGQFLAVPPATKQQKREFHFPPPSPRADAPHFQFAPPSPRGSPVTTHFPPPPSGPPPADSPRWSRAPTSVSQMNFPTPPRSENRPESAIYFPPPPTAPKAAHTKSKKDSEPSSPEPSPNLHPDLHISIPSKTPPSTFDFGFPSTPTEFQKNLMRFAFVGSKKKEGWSVEYGRPDLPYMLREMATRTSHAPTSPEDGHSNVRGFGRRTCVFVCGPPSMRVDVANTVAKMQADIWGDPDRDEIFLHTENYAI
jgi:predicted ferric reductase